MMMRLQNYWNLTMNLIIGLKKQYLEGDAINQLIENELDENMNSSMMVRKPIHLKTKISLGEIKMMYNSSFNYLYLMIYSRFCIDIEISTILPRRHYPGRRM